MSVSVKDVAIAASVSVGTVSNVLNRPDHVSEATRRRVHDAIERLGFVRNDAARQLRAGRSRTIGLVVLDARNPFFMEVARGAEECAAEHGLSVLIANSGDASEREAAHLELFEQQRAFGVLVTPVGAESAAIARLAARGFPLVLVDSAPAGLEVPSVAVDDVVGGRLAAAHLLAIGRRRLAFVGGSLSIAQVAERWAGAQAAVDAVAGATIEFVEAASLTVEGGRDAGARLASRDLADRPDAVFAVNDLLAVGLLQRFVMTGSIRVPADIALIGYDDIDFAASTVVPLSSVRQPAALIGRRAVEHLIALVDASGAPDAGAAPRVRFEPELVVRASTGG